MPREETTFPELSFGSALSPPLSFGARYLLRSRLLLLVPLAAMLFPSARGEESDLPLPVGEDHFQALLTDSPFTRSLDLSDSLVLTGIATIDGASVATILDRSSKETYIVSTQSNAQGWRMVGIEGNRDDLESMTASISLTGGEVVSIRFADHQLAPGEMKPAGVENAEGLRLRPEGRERPETRGAGKGKGKGKGESGDTQDREMRSGKGGARGSKGGGGSGGGGGGKGGAKGDAASRANTASREGS